MHHFSYLGDATVGDHVNISAGAITSNYSGLTKQKYRTIIGSAAFIGCGTVLVPPVTIGDHAMSGAGAVVNKDVPPSALVVGVPAHVLRILPQPDTPQAERGEKE